MEAYSPTGHTVVPNGPLLFKWEDFGMSFSCIEHGWSDWLKPCAKCQYREAFGQHLVVSHDACQTKLEALQTKLEALQAKCDDYEKALEEIKAFWENTETPKPYFIGDTSSEVLAKYKSSEHSCQAGECTGDYTCKNAKRLKANK